MVNQKQKEQSILEAHKLAEIYKAGFIDGYCAARKRRILWKSVFKKCANSFNKRFMKPVYNERKKTGENN